MKVVQRNLIRPQISSKDWLSKQFGTLIFFCFPFYYSEHLNPVKPSVWEYHEDLGGGGFHPPYENPFLAWYELFWLYPQNDTYNWGWHAKIQKPNRKNKNLRAIFILPENLKNLNFKMYRRKITTTTFQMATKNYR